MRDELAFEACFESQRRAWKASAEGVLADAQLFAQPWGFSLNELRVPVRLWHGDSDRSFSFGVAKEMAEKINKSNKDWENLMKIIAIQQKLDPPTEVC